MAPKIKVTYFNLRGRAEPVRLLLAYGGLEYEDCRLTPSWDDPKPWMALKPKTPYGGLPLLEWNGETLAQSIAITRFVAREVGLAGRNSLECAQADEVVDAFSDLTEAMAKAFFSKDDAQMKKYTTGPSGGDYFIGFIITLIAIGWVVAAVADFFMLTKIHGYYRATGASLTKAQAEFATNVFSNEGVRNAAASAAAAGVRQGFSQQGQQQAPRY